MELLFETLPLTIPILCLLIYFAIRWQYPYTCPECGRWSRERADVYFKYRASQSGNRHEVKVPAGGCSSCKSFWTLKDTHVKDAGLEIPKGTRIGRS